MVPGMTDVVAGLGGLEYGFLLAASIAGTLAGLVLWRRSFQNARIMEDTPTSRIRSAAQGFVEFAGLQDTAMDRMPRTPLTLREATWWSMKVERREVYRDGNGNRKTRWKTLEKKTSPHLIRLTDETGDVVVNPVGADVTPAVRRVWHGDGPTPTGPPSGAFAGLARGGRYRYTEEYMRPGEPLFALGHFETRTSAPDSAERSRRRTELLARWKKDPADLAARFDEDDDGRVDMQEWERARRAAQAAVEEQAARQSREPETHLLLKPADGRPFLLSVKSQAELARHYRIRSAGWVLLFLAGMGACGVLVSGRFGG